MPKSKVGLWQKQLALKYYKAHPDASISEVVKATGVATRTVTRARKDLVADGTLAAGRSAAAEPEVTEAIAAQIAPDVKDKLEILDHTAMTELADLMDEASEELDDETTRKRMLTNVRRIAFNMKLHPDTRMSATTTWMKLRDMAKSREMGPGKPKTRAEAVERLTLMIRAVGAELAMEAIYKAFNIKEKPDEGELPVNPSEDAPDPSGTPESPGSTDEIQEHVEE